MPTDLPVANRVIDASDGVLIAAFSILPWLVSLLLVHDHPAVAAAFVLLGQMG